MQYMQKIKRILLSLMLILSVGLSAQISYSGKVIVADSGEPIIGATIRLKNSSTGTISDVNGRFQISIAGSQKMLVISYVGMKSLEVNAVDGMVVKMLPDVAQLDEVLVVAYGTSTKKSFTGAATVIKSEKLNKGETSNVSKALEGAVAGVQISSSTGQPGSSANIRIRGLGSISASQSPLIIVDGVPYEGSLNSISPQDIESLNVLKDAAANSMYGARGSNGVILISTKKGQTGKAKVTLESRIGMNSRAVPAYNVITDPGDYYEMSFEAIRNNLVENGGMGYYPASVLVANTLVSDYLGYNIFKGVADNQLIDPVTGILNPAATTRKWNDNWLTDPFRSGVKQEYNLSVAGGNENTSAYFSASYLNDKGYVTNSDFSRLGARVKIDQQINTALKMGVNIAYSKTESNSPISSGGDTNFSNIFNFSQDAAPIYPIYKYDLATGESLYDINGNREYDFGSGNISNGLPTSQTRAYAAEQNPLYKLSFDDSNQMDDNLSSRFYVELKLAQYFTLTGNVAYDVFNSNATDFVNPLQGDGKTYNGIGYKTSQRYAALNANQLLNYNRKFGLHDVSVLLGHESKADDVWYLTGSKMNYYDPYNPEFANAGAISSLTSYTSSYRLEGYLSRIEYNYADKYYFSGSFRRDASSKFAPDVRWGNFWSLGGSWRVKEEDFMRDLEQITSLKLKSSYGTQGNDGIGGSNLYLYQYSLTSDGQNASPVLTYRGAPDLTWEKSRNFNLGFELTLIDKINVNADFFIKETKDMIYAKPLPLIDGVPTWIWDNQIDMKNTGVEIEIGGEVLKTKDLKWDVSLNLTSYKNQLTKVPDDKDPEGYVAGSYWRKIGGSLYDFYLYEYAGVDPETGLSMWYTDETITASNGQETTNKVTTTDFADAIRYETGKSSIPDLYGGLSSELKFKSFDFSIQTAFQLGGWVYDGVYASQMGTGTGGNNWNKDIYKRWTPTNTQTDVPRVSAGDQNVNAGSTRFLTSASYFNIKNITLGYTVPKRYLKPLMMQSARVFATGENLWLLTARQGLDTRQSFSGSVYSGTYSALRTISLGLNINF
jgi:TonB-linked SusC/RagA family outer membrane protein